MFVHRRVLTPLLCLLGIASVGWGQGTLGTITGLVSDSTGAVIPSADIVATNSATGVRIQTKSSSTGNYVIPNLQVGRYSVSATVTGFKSYTRSNIALSTDENIRIDIVLEVGSAAERVEITAEAPPLKTESTEVSTVMEQKLVNDMPLAIAGIGGGMRNAFSIMMMMPQVKSGNGEGAWDDLQIGGGQQHDFNVSVDGMSVEMGWRNHVGYMNRLTPSVDSVEEFRIDTSSFKAEHSRASGGNISVTTKSGTNEFHGSGFDFFQSQVFNANSWLNNKVGRAKSKFHRNDFGATIGGPVILPKIYNGKNKTYFFFSYEGYRWPSTSDAAQQTIPLANMLQGDFSDWRLANGNLIQIYDPATTRSDGKGGFTRDPFVGNIIPQARLSPLSRNIAQYYPNPNRPGLTNNYISPGTEPKKRIENAYTTKFDHNFSEKNRMSFTWTKNGMYFNNAYDSDPTNPMNWNGLPYPLAGRKYYNGDQYYGNVFRVNDTHIFTPNIVNNLTIGAHRLTHPEHDITVQPAGQNWGDKLGGAIGNNPGYNTGFPSVNFQNDNYYGWDSSKFWDEYHTVYGIDENLTWIKNNHSFKFGYSFQKMFLNTNNRNTAAGSFAFNRLSTSSPLDNSGNSGNAFASFMLGQVYSGNFTIPNTSMLRFPYHAFFAQDDWKVTSKLTINMGIRYEINMGVYEKHDRLSYFDPNLANPAASGQPGALRFLGTGTGREGGRRLYNNAGGWGPRLGVAYQLSENTVIRAGAGIFYGTNKAPGLGGANNGFTNAPSWTSQDQGINPAFQWDRGFPSWEAPPFINPGFNAGFSLPWFGAAETGRLPQTSTWNFALARVLPGNLVLDATYTGSKGTYLASDRVNIMQIDPKYAYLGSLLNRPIDDPQVAALGFREPFANFKQLMGANATLGQSLRAFPQYQNVTTGGMMNHSGNSTYHALILKATKRFNGGLSMLASYTWSKLLTDADSSEPWIAGVVGSGTGAGSQDQYNRKLDKSYGVLDLPQMFKLTASYDMPFGRGKKYLTSGVGGAVLGNWNLSTFMFYQSGYPMGVIDNGYINNLKGGTPRPDVLTHDWRAPIAGDRFDPSVDKFYDASAFKRRTDPASDPVGDAPRFNGSVRSFKTFRTNVAVTKGIPIWERVKADLRLEVFNLFNQKNWSNPTADLSNQQLFGVITNASGNRSMQVALKVIF